MDVETHWHLRDGRFRDKWVNKQASSSFLRPFFYTQSGISFWPDLVVFSKVGFLRKLGTLLLKWICSSVRGRQHIFFFPLNVNRSFCGGGGGGEGGDKAIGVNLCGAIVYIACVAGTWKWWAQEKTGVREGDARVFLARARSLFLPLLPSACYAGYFG